MQNKFRHLLAATLVLGLSAAHAQTATVTAKGSPYLDEKYINGVVHYADKSMSVPMRYNAHQDLIEYQHNGKTLVFDPVETISSVEYGDKKFVPAKLNSRLGYYVLLDTGKVSFYCKKKVTFLPGKKGGALDGSDQEPEYKKTPDQYFFRVGDGALQEVGNLKSMIAAFPDKQEELTQYAKKEKISPRRGEEIRKLVQYYNGL